FDFRVTAGVPPPVIGPCEKLPEDRIHGLPVRLCCSTHPSVDGAWIKRNGFLVQVVPIHQPAIESILQRRQMRRGAGVIAYVMRVIVEVSPWNLKAATRCLIFAPMAMTSGAHSGNRSATSERTLRITLWLTPFRVPSASSSRRWAAG